MYRSHATWVPRQTRRRRGCNRKGPIVGDKRTRKLAFPVLAAHNRRLMQTRTTP
jgi:hypothetical protein